jgi:hypothetical protein
LLLLVFFLQKSLLHWLHTAFTLSFVTLPSGQSEDFFPSGSQWQVISTVEDSGTIGGMHWFDWQV